MNISAAHSQTRRRSVAKIVKSEINDLEIPAHSPECDAHLIRCPVREDAITRSASRHRLHYHHRHLVEIDDAAIAVLRLWQHYSSVSKIDVEIAQPEDLTAP